MPRYTPGPWKMRGSGELWSYSRGDTPTEIGTISWTGNIEEREGNSRMIASASDLCESLDEVMLILGQPEVVEVILSNPKIAAKSKMIMETARTTLQEATGKPLPEWPKYDPHDKRLES